MTLNLNQGICKSLVFIMCLAFGSWKRSLCAKCLSRDVSSQMTPRTFLIELGSLAPDWGSETLVKGPFLHTNGFHHSPSKRPSKSILIILSVLAKLVSLLVLYSRNIFSLHVSLKSPKGWQRIGRDARELSQLGISNLTC